MIPELDVWASALEDAIARDIDDEPSYQVWSDYLMEAGDPLGEVIAMWLAIEDERDPARRALLRETASATQARLVADVIARVPGAADVQTDLVFRNGLVRRLTLALPAPERQQRRVAADVLAAVLGCSSGRALRELYVDNHAFRACAAVLERSAPRALVALVADGRWRVDDALGRDVGPAAPDLRIQPLGVLPRLSWLSLGSIGADFTGAELRSCRELLVNASHPPSLDTLGDASLPALEKLTIASNALDPLTSASSISSTRELVGPSQASTLADALARWPALRSIEVGEGLLGLAERCAERVPRLEELAIPRPAAYRKKLVKLRPGLRIVARTVA